MRLEREKRFEPSTLSLATRCSTTELLPLGSSYYTRTASQIQLPELEEADGIIGEAMDLSTLQTEVEGLTSAAGDMALKLQSNVPRELKPDGSIVTSADTVLESWLRPRLEELVPGTATWGEELGFSDPGPEGLWLVDPIDGTSNFAFGSPLWGVSVALYRNERIEVGSVSLPGLEEAYSGAVGRGARRNGEPLPPIQAGAVRPEELVSYSDGLMKKFPGIDWPGKMRHNGAFVVDAMFVASQRFRGLVDYKCKLYDIAASLVICSELGADIRHVDGAPIDMPSLIEDRKIGYPFVIFPMNSQFLAEV